MSKWRFAGPESVQELEIVKVTLDDGAGTAHGGGSGCEKFEAERTLLVLPLAAASATKNKFVNAKADIAYSARRILIARLGGY